MPRTSVLAIAIAIGFGGTAIAQTVHPPILPAVNPAVLVDHDKGENGHGRKLGHYKNRGGDENENDDENENGGRRSRSSRNTTYRNWSNPAPYSMPPGYGNTYPSAPYGYYPPPYYRGY